MDIPMPQLDNILMMKSIAVVALCLFAAVAGEADANADAGVLYGHYGYGHHLGYAHHGYYGYPYAHHYGHYYGKRSADAEPEAAAEAKPEAEADAYYGYYGHPLAYAHHGYYARFFQPFLFALSFTVCALLRDKWCPEAFHTFHRLSADHFRVHPHKQFHPLGLS